MLYETELSELAARFLVQYLGKNEPSFIFVKPCFLFLSLLLQQEIISVFFFAPRLKNIGIQQVYSVVIIPLAKPFNAIIATIGTGHIIPHSMYIFAEFLYLFRKKLCHLLT